MELGVLERLKKRCLLIFSVAIGPILAGKEDMHNSLDQFEWDFLDAQGQLTPRSVVQSS